MDKILVEFEEMLKQARQKMLEKAPPHIRELGGILRRSAETGRMARLRRFLRDHDVQIPRRSLEIFRDYLIVRRIDLKDLEPEARERLRIRMLAKEDPRKVSVDYRAAVKEGAIPHCRDCCWFVRAPNDGEPGAEESCVERGTKGADQACYGFTAQPN